MKIVTADGRVIERAHANAWDADRRMGGLSVTISIRAGGVKAAISAEDFDATAQWTRTEVDAMLVRMEQLAIAGDVAMCDEEGVEAWLT